MMHSTQHDHEKTMQQNVMWLYHMLYDNVMWFDQTRKMDVFLNNNEALIGFIPKLTYFQEQNVMNLSKLMIIKIWFNETWKIDVQFLNSNTEQIDFL